MKKVRLIDIANKTGYSVNTVSHALKDKADISETTKKYISGVAKEMGYIANVSASSLRSGKSRSIAIVVGDISNPHFSIMIKEMESKLRLFGYNAIIMNTDEDEEIEYNAIVSAIAKNVDGIIICPAQKGLDNIKFLEKSGIPFILIGRRFKDYKTDYVICDDENGGYCAADYLFKLGHKNLLFINAPLNISSADERYQGVQRLFKEKNIPLENLGYFEVPLFNNQKLLKDILSADLKYSAIICFSDIIAMQVCHILKSKNINVPGDISVMGFDNIASKFTFPLMITSVTSSKTKMSEVAVDSILKKIENKNFGRVNTILSTKVVERESTK